MEGDNDPAPDLDPVYVVEVSMSKSMLGNLVGGWYEVDAIRLVPHDDQEAYELRCIPGEHTPLNSR
jgi:hypothetical protein